MDTINIEGSILRLREILEERGMNVKALSDLTGLSYTYTTEIVRGDKFPSKSKLLLLAAKLDVDLPDLFLSLRPNKHIPLFTKNEHGAMVKIGGLACNPTQKAIKELREEMVRRTNEAIKKLS